MATAEEEKARVRARKDPVPVVFITSSAIRGLSFPLARNILAEVPRFQMENTLVEIIQVIYRGRRGPAGAAPKEIIFYISNRIVTTREEREMAARESALDTLNLLILLKAAVSSHAHRLAMGRQRREGGVRAQAGHIVPAQEAHRRRAHGRRATGRVVASSIPQHARLQPLDSLGCGPTIRAPMRQGCCANLG